MRSGLIGLLIKQKRRLFSEGGEQQDQARKFSMKNQGRGGYHGRGVVVAEEEDNLAEEAMFSVVIAGN